jgi:peptidoglycan/LPS O-acetylase OafA/YrhL
MVPAGGERDSWLEWISRFGSATVGNGPAAVIAFFVISGLCIHYPNVLPGNFRPSAHYAQRFLRILPPMLVALLAGGVVGAKGIQVSRETWQLPTILWSLVAELIYYTVYPALRVIAGRIGWPAMLGTAYAFAGLTMILNPAIKGMQDFGYGLTWIVGLPNWLWGCLLAERIASRAPALISGKSVIWPRAALFLMSALGWRLLYVHKPYLPANAFIISLQAIGATSFLWLRAEVDNFRTVLPWRLLEWAGTWSYSLYLIHELGRALWEMAVPAPSTIFEALAGSVFRPLVILAICYGFYRLVELPSHRLARRAGAHFRKR